jgi:hypothetical protein
MSFDNTQITSASSYDVNNIVYSKPRDGSIPNSSVVFKRVQMGTRNPDGSLGELILETERLFSFGLSPSVNMTTGKTDGYTLALCMWSMDAPTKKEKEFTDTFNRICENASEYILQHRDEVCKYELEKADLKKFNPLYLKKDKGKIVEGASPMLYAKVLQNKKTDSITSIFYDENGRDIDPMSLMNKQCHVKAAIKIEGIFIGSKVSLQVKLYEAEIRLKESGVKRLLRPIPSSNEVELTASSLEHLNMGKKEKEEEDDDKGSLKDEDAKDEDVKEESKKKPVRRVQQKK